MIFLALGSNLGDRSAALLQAQAHLAASGVEVLRASGVLETPALVPEGAPPDWSLPYLNQVLEVHAAHDPHRLLQMAKAIEAQMGRAPSARWAPRVIDIDLVAYDDRLVRDEVLELPHAQMHNRRFVLAPLCELAPHWRHPRIGRSARELLAALPA